MKKYKYSHPTDRVLIGVIVVLLALLVSVLWYFGDKINILWSQNAAMVNYYNSTGAMTLDTKVYVQTALRGLYSSTPVTDPVQKRVYFPEASIYVPMNSTSRQLVYRYAAADGSFPAQLTITHVSNLNALPNTFADVPCLQRHINAVFDNQNSPDGQLVSTKVLANGHTMYIYRHQEGDCSAARWSTYSAKDIIGLLNQAQSY